jgi:hypothetical protein
MSQLTEELKLSTLQAVHQLLSITHPHSFIYGLAIHMIMAATVISNLA